MRIGDLGISRRVLEKRSGILFRVAGQDHYGEGITTLLTDRIIGVRALDAAESGPMGAYPFEQSGKFGNNNYPDSNLHQWLNSAEEHWFQPKHGRDTPPVSEFLRYGDYPYADTPGFLSQFSETMRSSLVKTDIPVLVRTGRGKAELHSVSACAFLASRTEMNKGSELGIDEGRPLPIFYDHFIFKAVPSQEQLSKYGRDWNPAIPERNVPLDAAQIYDPKFGWWYYMRTPSTMYKFMQRVMSPYGAVSFTYANNDIVGIRPLVNVSANLEIQDVGLEAPIYCID